MFLWLCVKKKKAIRTKAQSTLSFIKIPSQYLTINAFTLKHLILKINSLFILIIVFIFRHY